MQIKIQIIQTQIQNHTYTDLDLANTNPDHTNTNLDHANSNLDHANTNPDHTNSNPDYANTKLDHANTNPDHTNRYKDPDHARNGSPIRNCPSACPPPSYSAIEGILFPHYH